METRIELLKAVVKLQFFYMWYEARDAGRYLTIQTPRGQITVRMHAFDWAHNSRTSLYITPDRGIAGS